MKRQLLFSIPLLFAFAMFISIKAHGQLEQIHYFNFNQNTPPTNTNWDQPIAAIIGSGELTYTFTEAYSFAGTTVNGNPGEVNGGSFVPRGGVELINNGAYFVLSIPTTGYANIVLTYATQRTNTGFTSQTVEYTTDGENWTEFIVIDDIPGSFGLRTVDFSAVADANENHDFAVRFILNGANTAAGNNRFDNISVSGLPVGTAAAPVFTPAGGTFFSPIDVTINTSTEGATILYSLTSDEGPWEEYSVPVTLDATTTIYAYATAADMDDSDVVSAVFNFPAVTEVETIAALRDMPVDGTIYMYTGEAVIVAMDGFRNRKFIQDETAAILIDDNPGVITTEYELYDVITAVPGKLNLFNNMLRFQPEANTPPATINNPIDPLLLALDEITEDDQAKLLQFENVSFVNISEGQSFASGNNYTITDGEVEFVLRTDFWNVDYIGETIPDTPLNITGVIIQFNEIFQIVPRFAADFEDYLEDEPGGISEFPWIEGFEDGELPEGWQNLQVQGPIDWQFFAGDQIVYTLSEQGYGEVEVYLVSPQLNLSGHEVVSLGLSHMIFSETAPDGAPIDQIIAEILVSTDGGSTWHVVDGFTGAEGTPGIYDLYQYDISAIAGEQPNVHISLAFNVPDFDYFYFTAWEVAEISVSTEGIATYEVTFEVEDEDGAAITDAVVIFNDVENEPGDYVFDEIPQGNYTYTVQREGYYDATGTVEVIDEDVTVGVTLNLITFTVTFDVYNTNFFPIDEAVVEFDGVANEPGNYVFTTIPGTFSYLVTADGFEDFAGEVEVAENITETVYLAFEPIPAASLPFAEDFTGYTAGELPEGWARTTPLWQINNTNEAGGDAPEISFELWNAMNVPFDGALRLHTPWIDAGTRSELTLSFNHYVFDNLGFVSPESGVVVEMTTDGETWTELYQANVANIGPETLELELGEVGGSEFMIAFAINKATGFDPLLMSWFIDDILIQAVEEEPADYEILFELSHANGTLPDYFSAGSTERGFGVDQNNVYVASRSAGNLIRVHDRITGEYTGTLNTNGISGGLFPINDIETTGDGVILTANLTLDASINAFKVYAVDAVEDPEVVIEYSAAGRYGDKFTVVGNMADGSAVLYAINGNAPVVLRFALEPDGNGSYVFGEPTTINLGVAQGGSPAISPKPDGTLFVTGNGQSIHKLAADGSLIGSIPGTVVATGSNALRFLGMDGEDELLAVFTYGAGNENMRIIRLPGGVPADAVLEFVTPSLGSLANPNGAGDVEFIPRTDGNVDLYVLSTNNGLGGYSSLQFDLEFPVYTAPDEEEIIISEFPWLEDFEEDQFPPAGWERINVDGGGTEWIRSSAQNHTPDGSFSAFHNYSSAGYQEGWLISPAIEIPETDVYALSFWSYNTFPTWYVKNSVLISSGSSNPDDGDFVEVWSPASVAASWTETVLILEDYTGETIYVAFVYEGDDAHAWYLDDVGINMYIPPVFYTVTFEVEDIEGLAIDDAVITLGSVTNAAGDYVFDVEAGDYDYLVTAAGYDDVMGSVIVIDEDITEIVVMPFETPAYCEGGPTTTIDSNVEHVYIEGANETQIDHQGCPGVIGVEDLTHLIVDLHQGQTYTLLVKFGTCGSNYFGAGSVWIDWGQDFVFDAQDLVHESTGNPGTTWADPVLITFTVPLDAELGHTVMRVMQQESGTLPLNPCASFSWGSVMDFGVNVLEETDDPIEPVLDLIFNQPYHDGGTAAASAFDTDAAVDYEVADNFFELDEEIEEFVFYGLTMYHDGTGWQEMVPDDTEPFFVRFYEYAEGLTTGLIAPLTGDYEIGLLDSYGDGWNGGMVTVYVNGIAVLSDITLPSGAGPVYHIFYAEEGDEISTSYTAGNWAYENYYAIIDPDGNIIAEDGGTWDSPGLTTPEGIAPGGDVDVLEPNWAEPLYVFNVDAEVTHIGPIWNGQRQLYKFVVAFEEPIDLEEGWVAPQIDADNGSGTWFLWLNSLVGDQIAWQRVGSTKNAPSRDMVARGGVSEKDEFTHSRGVLNYDLAFELWGGELSDPPVCATNPLPVNNAMNIAPQGNLSWTGDPIADGYLLYLGEAGANWNIYEGEEIGKVTSYPYQGLAYSTTYEWKVVPFNAAGSPDDCPVWSFTTEDDPVIVPPLLEPFTTTPFPPTNWSRMSGILSENTVLVPGSAWFHHFFGNVTGPNNSAYINMYSTKNHWLITPPINLGDGGYQVEFDIALTPWVGQAQVNLGPDDYVAFVISRDGGQTWSDANVLIDWDASDVILPTGNNIILDIADETGIVKFGIYGERPSGFQPDLRFYFTNFQVRIPPDSPTFSISDSEWDFNFEFVGEQTDPKLFSISNTGVGVLHVAAPIIDNDIDFVLNFDPSEYPAELGQGESVTFEVIFAPESAGEKLAQISIDYNDGEENTAIVSITGEGFVPPPGSTCDNPLVVTLPLVDYMDNTELYGDNYSANYIIPSNNYLNGNDFVAQFTLDAPAALSGSVAGSWTGLFILEDCPDSDNPANVLASASGMSGGSITNIVLPAGTYFAIVSTWPAPQFTGFTLNLSTLPVYTLTFDVVGAFHGYEIDDAIITLNGVANEAGNYAFQGLVSGTYAYTVSRLCYADAVGVVTVTENTLVEIELDLNIQAGDANGDGVVNVLDIITIGNYYIGNDPAFFCFHNADVNGDGEIDVLDIIGTINIYAKGVIAPHPGIQSIPASIYLTEDGIALDSDGTITGIQFEITGDMLQNLALKLELPKHEIIYVYQNDLIRALIFSMENAAIPPGKISLVSFGNDVEAEWKSVKAGNINAIEVPVVIHDEEVTTIEEIADVAFKAYPNPASDVLWVEFNNVGESHLSLINVQGQIVETMMVSETGYKQISFNLGNLPAGIYMLRLEHNNETLTERIMIK